MRQKVSITIIIILAFAGSYFGKKMLLKKNTVTLGQLGSSTPKQNKAVMYKRIISLAPSITETLFSLDLGENVVGVTRYCVFPVEAQQKAKIGGYYDPSYEAIVALRPDLVIMLPEHEVSKKSLANLDVKTLVVNHNNITEILNSILVIGKACTVEKKALALISSLKERMAHVKQKTHGLPRPKILVSIGRNMGSGSLKDVYIASQSSFYGEIIECAGGTNAYQGKIPFPIVTAEGINGINPQVILDMIPDIKAKGWDEKTILKEWQTVSQVDAVKNNSVYIMGEDYVVVAGPRFILILEQMARLIHPEAAWN